MDAETEFPHERIHGPDDDGEAGLNQTRESAPVFDDTDFGSRNDKATGNAHGDVEGAIARRKDGSGFLQTETAAIFLCGGVVWYAKLSLRAAASRWRLD